MEWIIASVIAMLGAVAVGSMQYDTTEAYNKIQKDIANDQNTLAVETLDYNKKMDAQQFEYNKWLNEMQMQREDTAVQRRMADLKAAGLNPLMAAGDAASSGAGGTLSRNQVAAPDLQAPNLKNEWDAFSGIFNNSYQSALQGYQTYQQSQKNNADISLIKSQTDKNNAEYEAQKTQNEWLERNLYTGYLRDLTSIESTLQDIELKKSKLKGQESSNEYQVLKNQEQIYINAQQEIRKKIMEHDWEIYKDIELPTSVVDKGGQTIYGQGYEDSVLVNGLKPVPASEVYTGTKEETDNLIRMGNTEFDSAVNKGSGATGEPYIKVEPNSVTVGYYQDKGEIDGSFIVAGNGYKTFNSGDTYYGGYPVKQSNLNDFLKAIHSGAKKIPMYWLVINRAK